ncbi:hypothetical protein GGX14DRAFT_394533 [Mycena pura]|uniref:Uncharacterized protein n=1 Tax=Mycena pura TaxID=153505 RepID=A0AAD6VFC1_9AGAR|nr:hypothetical protein GGX14DRAFT_394533 [Mycena pura]
MLRLWAAGQPVSMANIKATAALARQHGISRSSSTRAAGSPRTQPSSRHSNAAIRTRPSHRSSWTCLRTPTASPLSHSRRTGSPLEHGRRTVLPRRGGVCVSVCTRIGIHLKERQIVCYGNDSYGGMSGWLRRWAIYSSNGTSALGAQEGAATATRLAKYIGSFRLPPEPWIYYISGARHASTAWQPSKGTTFVGINTVILATHRGSGSYEQLADHPISAWLASLGRGTDHAVTPHAARSAATLESINNADLQTQ